MKFCFFWPTLICLILFAPHRALALVELNGNFIYQKQVFGAQRENNIRSRTYAGSTAIYLFEFTAIEFNYSENHEITTTHNEFEIDGTDISVVGSQNKVVNRVAGVGIRQALAPRKASIRPLLSIGYARQFINDRTNYTLRNDVSESVWDVHGQLTKRRVDSVFGTFALDVRLTKTFALKGSVHTVFKAFEFDKAKDNLKYLVGFSWYL